MNIPSKIDIALYLILAAVSVGLIAVVKSWHDRAVYELPAAKRAAKELQAAYTNLATAAAANQAKTETHGHAHDDNIEKQHADRSNTPTRDVRLCTPARVPTATAARHAAVADHEKGGAELPEAPRPDIEVGRNIGPELYGEADRADDVAVTLNSCIDWANDNR